MSEKGQLFECLRELIRDVGWEAIDLRGVVSLHFPPGEVVSVVAPQRDASDGVHRVSTHHLPLAGHGGPLPDAWALRVWEDERRGEGALGDFLALFHRRLLRLDYDAWEGGRFFIPRERGEGDPLTEALQALAKGGAGGGTLPLGVDLGEAPRSAAGLSATLRQVLGDVSFVIKPLVGAWLPVALGARARLGRRAVLGEHPVLGRRVWDLQAAIEVEVGPLSRRAWRRWRPSSPGARCLASALDEALGPTMSWQLVYRVEPDALEPQRVGWGAGLGRGAPLGRVPDSGRGSLQWGGRQVSVRWVGGDPFSGGRLGCE